MRLRRLQRSHSVGRRVTFASNVRNEDCEGDDENGNDAKSRTSLSGSRRYSSVPFALEKYFQRADVPRGGGDSQVGGGSNGGSSDSQRRSVKVAKVLQRGGKRVGKGARPAPALLRSLRRDRACRQVHPAREDENAITAISVGSAEETRREEEEGGLGEPLDVEGDFDGAGGGGGGRRWTASGMARTLRRLFKWETATAKEARLAVNVLYLVCASNSNVWTNTLLKASGHPDVVAFDWRTMELIWSTILTFTITFCPALVLFILLALNIFPQPRYLSSSQHSFKCPLA